MGVILLPISVPKDIAHTISDVASMPGIASMSLTTKLIVRANGTLSTMALIAAEPQSNSDSSVTLFQEAKASKPLANNPITPVFSRAPTSMNSPIKKRSRS